MQQSECARATTAAESRFRLERPNSRRRSIRIVALDPASQDIADNLVLDLPNAKIVTLPEEARALMARPKDGLNEKDGRLLFDGLSPEIRKTVDALTEADMVIMVVRSGDDARASAFIAEACWPLGIATTGLVLARNGDTEEAASSDTLRQLRPHAFILTVAADLEFIEALIQALGGQGA